MAREDLHLIPTLELFNTNPKSSNAQFAVQETLVDTIIMVVVLVLVAVLFFADQYRITHTRLANFDICVLNSWQIFLIY